MSNTTGAPEPPKKLSLKEILQKSAASAARGGTAGAAAMGANVAALMWIRTTVRISLVWCLGNE